MKKNLFLFISFVILYKTNGQVVFCPPGTEWHYNFGLSPTQLVNEEIRYSRDSIIGSDTFKVLSHTRYYYNCNFPAANFLTLIKQRGDTIFFRNNRTQNTWQILYNFAVQVGQGWQTTILKTDNSIGVFNNIVDSIKFVNINNTNLKRMYVGQHYITERLGSDLFLFDFFDSNCEGDLFAHMLCYQDAIFGLKKFTAYSCDFSGFVGIHEYNENDFIKLFPNPINNFLSIETSNTGKIELSFTNIYGEEIKKMKFEGSCKLELGELKNGIYFISISNETGVLYNTKLVKE